MPYEPTIKEQVLYPLQYYPNIILYAVGFPLHWLALKLFGKHYYDFLLRSVTSDGEIEVIERVLRRFVRNET